LTGCSGALFKKEFLSQIGLFDVSVPGPTEDWDFFRRFSKKGRIGFCSEILVHYRRHANNISNKSSLSYYVGNSVAVLKMIHDDFDIGFAEKRLIWFRFQYISAKSFAKNKNYLGCCAAIVKTILPLP
jgi:GT2 family glycosyltransferase